jgi:hypothetical protein
MILNVNKKMILEESFNRNLAYGAAGALGLAGLGAYYGSTENPDIVSTPDADDNSGIGGMDGTSTFEKFSSNDIVPANQSTLKPQVHNVVPNVESTPKFEEYTTNALGERVPTLASHFKHAKNVVSDTLTVPKIDTTNPAGTEYTTNALGERVPKPSSIFGNFFK